MRMKIIIAVLLIGIFICIGFFVKDFLTQLEYTIDTQINTIYEKDLKNEIILNEDTINILNNIDDRRMRIDWEIFNLHIRIQQILNELKLNGSNELIWN